MESLKVGACSSCDKQIFDITKPKQSRMSEDYREHTMGLSNDTLLKVGICADCKKTLDSGGVPAKEIADLILERHKLWWKTNVTDSALIEKISVMDVSTDEKIFKEKLEKQEEEKCLTRDWQSEKMTQNILGVDEIPITESLEEFMNRKK